ncbi:hypothetical protein C7T35_21800 [Variovorax sp. WS11]|uniref:hypothetical protein n=1 Tax=Variovorax sp. WS11 TaxID=1105204 RepID=UPI000D0CE866|nr:hypothetical protein [Variovorax sp. WS11]NDZ18958.1 hypothetical protein [Variovorax sp. WS11]PSL82466.1 hypothetical protein C7T35_21800 [Variovorax sp. WS11]
MTTVTQPIVIDPNVTWVAVEQRLSVETDPVVRENLELVLAHMKYEAAGDIERVLTTICSRPKYRFYVPGFTHIDGDTQEPLRQFYQKMLIGEGALRLEMRVERVLADRKAVSTEGVYRQAYLGRALLDKGIEVDDPDAYYAAECRMLLTWPRHETEPKLVGEEAWVDRDMFEGIASRKITEFVELAASHS